MLIAARVVQGLAAGGLMSLAIAAVGDLVAPRERARYQGYSVSVFAVATVAGPLAGDLLVDHTSWRWVFYVNLPLGVAAVTGLRLRMPAAAAAPAAAPLDLLGAALLAGTTSALMLACIRGGQRYPWGSPAIVSLLCAASALSVGLVVRERRAADPIVPLELLRSRTVAVAAAALFLATAALFAVNVFVLFLQTTTGASPTQAGLLLVPMMLGITVSTYLAGRAIQATGRYKAFSGARPRRDDPRVDDPRRRRRAPVAGGHRCRFSRVRTRGSAWSARSSSWRSRMMSTAATWAPRWPPPRSSAASAARSGRPRWTRYSPPAASAHRKAATPVSCSPRSGWPATAPDSFRRRSPAPRSLPPCPTCSPRSTWVMADVGVADPRPPGASPA